MTELKAIDSSDINISPVKTEELTTLREISIKTFTDAFAADNKEMYMKEYLAESFSTKQLTEELANANSSFFFARTKDQVIGYLKINWGSAQSENQKDHSLEIERIYIIDKFQGNQFGQQLLDKALDIARKKAVDSVWLSVWEHNTKAIKFYQENGFVFQGTHEFLLGTDRQTDLIMRLEL